MATTDLVYLIFTEILKIDSITLSKYSTLSDQTLFLLFIPHIILFFFLYAFSFGITARITGTVHKGFSYLLGIASYIYIVYSGWYGRLVVLFLGWMYMALGMALFLFIISIIWHPSATSAGMKMVGEVGKEVAKRTIGKEKEKKAIEDEINALKKEISALRAAEQSADPTARSYLQMQIAGLEAQRRRLESRL